MASSLSYRGDHRAALESATRAEALARNADASLEIARAVWMQGSAHYRLGEPRAALALAEQALAIASDVSSSNEMGRSLNLLGAAHYALGQYEQAESYWEDALKLFQELGNRQQGMLLLNNLAAIADARGDHAAAFHRYHSALEMAREIGNRDGEILFLTNRGGEQVALENYGAAEADLRQAIELAGTTGSWCLPITYNDHAEALIGLSRYEDAMHSAQQALFLAEDDKTPEYIGMAWRTLGKVSLKLDKPFRLRERDTQQMRDYDARACFEKSEKIFAEAEIDMERARTLREWAKYEFQMNNRDRAIRMWQESRDIFSKLGAEREVQRMAVLPA
jgi:tetratricopeptide (TPR) repeat protein